ncbi:MAG: hypothetical protein AB8B63_01940 [Granulosicoccus sp.]
MNNSKSACVDNPSVLGIRPESVVFTSPDNPDAIPITIEAETPLNEKIVTLAVTEGNREILISRPAGTDGPSSGRAFVAINQDALLLFDRASGHLIDSEQSMTMQGEAAA